MLAVALFSGECAGDDHLPDGFEPPAYSVGQLAGQDGWFNLTFPMVENSMAFSGTQAGEFVADTDTNGGRGQSFAFQNISYNAVGNPEQLVTVQDDFFVSTQATQRGGRHSVSTRILVSSYKYW